ncbi:ABC transporter [Rhizoctonia solani]|uniref:ABC transporter n=2 Tax=Rhizoctonia solani TaxID=456999 RepID=A0A8H7IIP3_9AGAM|nr:ABC transporter [Rhizoctonia solani]
MSRYNSGIASDPATAVPSRAPSETIDMQDTEKHQHQNTGINVHNAEKQFNDLARRLTRQSTHRDEKGGSDPDIENQQSFDLLEYLRSTSGKQNQAGFAHKHVGVTFHDLRVIGVGGVKIYVRTFPDAVKEFLLSPLYIAASLLGKKPSAPKTILHSFNGTVRPGEMVLVLGRPGSGCSSFLKTIANQRGSFLEVTGDVRYAGIGAQEFGKQFAGETVYNMEGKWGYASVCTEPQVSRARLPEQTRAQLNDEVLDMLLSMLNITHTRERKRVSIAEMMATRACVLSWDNSTRGLDASTALDYAKSLRIMTDIFKLTTFVSLYQAGEGIYDQFDKVLLIDEGRQVYFGPAKEARDYMLSLGFRNLPRQTTADYLTGCTDPNERAFAEGRSEVDVPSTPDQLAEAFERSKYWSQMVAEREAVEEEWRREEKEPSGARGQFLQATKEEKRKHVSRKDPHVVTFLSMVKTLVWRQWLMQIQDTFSIFTSFATAIIISILSGTVYLNLPLTSAGAFTRGGVIFLHSCSTPSMRSANWFVPAMMTGRPILYKQLSYRFYRASALSVAQTITDIPLTAIRILIFSIIIYFMCGLQRSAGAFFTFYLFIYITFLAMAAFFRLIGIICQGYDMAARLAASIVTLMVVYSGYMIPVYAMKRWLFWIWYLNPVNYGFAAMMENEFYRIDMNCDGNYIIPHNVGDITKYPTTLGPNQVCTLLGAFRTKPGDAYIAAGFEYQKAHIWRNLGIVLLYWFGFIVLQILAMEKFQSVKAWCQCCSDNYLCQGDQRNKELNMRLKERKASARKGQDDQNVVVTNQPRLSPGRISTTLSLFPAALVAPQQGLRLPGKTTLLDVLAGRKTIGVIHGDVLIGGERTGIAFQRGTAYCEQLDVHESTATVREALRFSAYLRQPYDVSKEEKDTYVEEVIALLEMEDIADAMIGQPGVGLGVEARKRVTIGVELAAKPQLLLFLDEPTSGLDGQSAYNIVRFLKKLAAGGQAILCTIHQPNALLFEQFDNLLLLQRGVPGRAWGALPCDANPAEFMLEAIGAGSRERIGPTDWAELWRQSENFARVKEEIAEIKEDAARQAAVADPNANKKYATPFMYQLRVVSERTLTAFWRQPDYGFTRLFTHGVIALITSLTFLQLGNSTQELQYRVFSIFIATIMPAIIISQVEPMFIIARMIFIRESSSRMYSEFAFALGQLMAEMPYSLLCAVVYFLLFYYPTGFQYASDRAGYQFLMFLVTEVFAVTLGQMIAALTPTVFIAGLLNPFILVTFSLFCGVMIPKDSIPKFWRVWLYQLDPFTHYLLPLEFAVFQPPQGQTCLQWAGDFVNASVGYLDNPGSTSDCRYCPYEYGDDFYSGLGISFDTRWRDFGILIAFTVFNTIVTLIASRVFKFSKR